MAKAVEERNEKKMELEILGFTLPRPELPWKSTNSAVTLQSTAIHICIKEGEEEALYEDLQPNHKLLYPPNQRSRERSFKWVLNYYFAKFLEILTTGSLEISKRII